MQDVNKHRELYESEQGKRLSFESDLKYCKVCVCNELLTFGYKLLQWILIAPLYIALPMDEKRAPTFGLMKIDEKRRIIEFSEKPKGRLV